MCISFFDIVLYRIFLFYFAVLVPKPTSQAEERRTEDGLSGGTVKFVQPFYKTCQ